MKEQAPNEGEAPRAASETAAFKEAGPAFAKRDDAATDLSSEIIKALPKSTGERVTCRHITGDNYRCNWWSPQTTGEYDNPTMTGLTVTTHRVGKSQWLHVTRTGSALTIKQSVRV